MYGLSTTCWPGKVTGVASYHHIYFSHFRHILLQINTDLFENLNQIERGWKSFGWKVVHAKRVNILELNSSKFLYQNNPWLKIALSRFLKVVHDDLLILNLTNAKYILDNAELIVFRWNYKYFIVIIVYRHFLTHGNILSAFTVNCKQPSYERLL